MPSEEFIILGYSCNNNCIHCFNGETVQYFKENNIPFDKSTEEVKEIISGSIDKDIEYLVLTGGEPTIRSDFFEILKYVKKNGFKLGLQTNGRAFSNKIFAEKVLSMCPELSLIISVHHTSKDIHDKITRVKGSWKQTIEGITNLIDLGCERITVKVVITKLNYKNLPKLVELTQKLRINKIDLTFMQGLGAINWNLLVPRYTEIQDYLIKAIKKAEKKNLEPSTYAIPFCFLGDYKNLSGDFKYIKKWVSGYPIIRDVPEGKQDIIKDMVLAKRRKSRKCVRCKFFNICEGVWEEYLRFFGSKEFKPIEGKKINTLKELRDLMD